MVKIPIYHPYESKVKNILLNHKILLTWQIANALNYSPSILETNRGNLPAIRK